MLFYYVLAAPGSSFIQRFKVQAEILWVEILVNARLRATHILLVVYTHHVTSKSRDVRICARVVHFNNDDVRLRPKFQEFVTLQIWRSSI